MSNILKQNDKNKNKRLEILRACAQFFYERGYRGTSLEDVAEQLNITKPAIYYYFKNKEEILCELYSKAVDYLLENMELVYKKEEPSDEKLINMIKTHIDVITYELPLITIFFQEKNELPKEYKREIASKKLMYENYFVKTLENGINDGTFSVQDPILSSRHILGMCNWILHWYEPNRKYSPEDLSENIISIVLKGVISEEKISK